MNGAKRYIFYVVVWVAIIAVTWLVGDSLSNRPAVLSADASGAMLAIPRNTDGHYYIDGSINGHPVRFLVDTGASYVSVGGELASRIGLPRGEPAIFGTAAGQSPGELVKGQTVSIGALTISKLSVGVNPGAGNMALLGQNFLKHVVLTQGGGQLELRFVPTASPFLSAKPSMGTLLPWVEIISLVLLALFMRRRTSLGQAQGVRAKATRPLVERRSPFGELLLACGGDIAKAARLIAYERTKAPSISKEEAIKRALERLWRDRQ